MGLIQDQDAYIMAWYYNFTPWDPGKYEATHITDDLFWNVLAADTPNTGILVKYNADDLTPPP